jgi:hypothetical protein
MMSQKIKAVGLLSGGLDSCLAVRVVQEQGVEVIGLSCKHPFHARPPGGEKPYPERVAEELGIELVRPDVTDKMLAMVKNPPHGYGKHLNPCIDCRIIYLKEGASLMTEHGAKLLITGEVLGQRPMSQRRDAMDIIDRDSGLRGLILRPLCARLMKPTIAEEKGWVDRDRLHDISGRSRKKQMELAKKFELETFSSPGGGCLLTMEDFARKMQDLMKSRDDFDGNDVDLLKSGRHFRLSPDVKLVVGKNDSDNKRIAGLARSGDLVITSVDAPGPLGLLRGEAGEEKIKSACAIIGRYVSRAKGPVKFLIKAASGEEKATHEVAPFDRGAVEDYRI